MLRSINYSQIPIEMVDEVATTRSAEPVTVVELKKQLRIDHGEDDADLAAFLVEARRECETVKLGDRALIEGTCVDYFDEFDDEMELHWSRVSSIDSVQYVDTNGTTQTLADTVYELKQKLGMGVLQLKYNQSWPTIRDHTDVVIVTYTAGYGDEAGDVPEAIRRWIKARAAWCYENRDGPAEPWSPLMDCLLSPFATSRVHAE